MKPSVSTVVALALFTTTISARAQGGLDPDSLSAFGGSYAANCRTADGLRLNVAADALTIEHGTKKVVARNVQAAASFLGPEPPAGYLSALLGELPGGDQLVFVVYRDKSGRYVKLDADAKLQATFGKAALARKFPSCEPEKPETKVAPASAASATTTGAAAITSPWDLLADRQFKAAYLKALGPKTKDRWLLKLDGPASPNRTVDVAGITYVLAASCKPHDCGDNKVVLIYAAAQKVVYGKLLQGATSRLLGAPPPAVAAELERLWAAEWPATPPR